VRRLHDVVHHLRDLGAQRADVVVGAQPLIERREGLHGVVPAGVEVPVDEPLDTRACRPERRGDREH